MASEAVRRRLGSIIGGFDAAMARRRLRRFRASRAPVNTLIAASGDRQVICHASPSIAFTSLMRANDVISSAQRPFR